MIARRTLLAAGPALLASPVLAAPSKDIAVRGSKAYSESAMVMSVSADGKSAITLRFCRFPVEGFTWLWCHVMREGQIWAFTSHDLPATPDRLAGTPEAAYRAPPMDASLIRTGRGPQLTEVKLSAALPFHHGPAAPHGPGKSPGRFEGRFTPTRALSAQVLEGRDEVYGTFRADVEVGGRRFVHQGPAKFHEQRQEAARFQAPFNYAWLSGRDADATTLLLMQGATGGWQTDGGERALADMTVDPPGQVRKLAYRFKDGQVMTGRLENLARYVIPIYDRTWHGSFVRGEAGGRAIVGASNDWTAEPNIYAAARDRAQKW